MNRGQVISEVGNQGQGTPSIPVALCLVKLDLIFFSRSIFFLGPCRRRSDWVGSVAENVYRKTSNLVRLLI